VPQSVSTSSFSHGICEGNSGEGHRQSRNTNRNISLIIQSHNHCSLSFTRGFLTLLISLANPVRLDEDRRSRGTTCVSKHFATRKFPYKSSSTVLVYYFAHLSLPITNFVNDFSDFLSVQPTFLCSKVSKYQDRNDLHCRLTKNQTGRQQLNITSLKCCLKLGSFFNPNYALQLVPIFSPRWCSGPAKEPVWILLSLGDVRWPTSRMFILNVAEIACFL
jgi:hypothetical protein